MSEHKLKEQPLPLGRVPTQTIKYWVHFRAKIKWPEAVAQLAPEARQVVTDIDEVLSFTDDSAADLLRRAKRALLDGIPAVGFEEEGLGITVEFPVTEFEHIRELAGVCAQYLMTSRKMPPDVKLDITVLSYTKMEQSLIARLVQ